MTSKAVALALVASVATGSVSQAAPVAANPSAIKAAAFGGVTKIQWGWWVAGAAVGAFAGAAWAAHRYRGCGYYGGYGCEWLSESAHRWRSHGDVRVCPRLLRVVT